MHLDVRTAALNDSIEHRVRLAVSLLGAHRFHARTSPWDGTRCDLLIASADDAYGAQALALARRRGTALIALGRTNQESGIPLVDPEITALALSGHIRVLLQRSGSSGETRVKTAPAFDASPQEIAGTQRELLCQLAKPPLRGKAVDVLCGNEYTVQIRPQVGRAYAATPADLVGAWEQPPEAETRIVVVDGTASSKGWVSVSLESMLLRAGHRMSEQLPLFPDGHYRLDTWPDVGALPSMMNVMRIAKLLIDNTKSIGELRASKDLNVAQVEINTCLWAFAAADLLHDAPSDQNPVVMPVQPPRAEKGLLSSLARRFGLWLDR